MSISSKSSNQFFPGYVICSPASCSLFQVNGDLDALEAALGGDTVSHVPGSGSCSALVKVLPGNAELFVSHDTWTEYNTMLRIYKLYDLKFRTSNATNGEWERGVGEGV